VCAFDLAQEGKFFEGLPYFKKYKHEENFQEHKLEKGEITPQKSSFVITTANYTAKRSNAKGHITLQGNGNIAPIKS